MTFFNLWIIKFCFVLCLICLEMPLLKNKHGRSCEKRFHSDAQRKKFARLSDTSEAREARLNRQMEYQAAHYAKQSSQEKAERLEAQVEYQTAHFEKQSCQEKVMRLEAQLRYQTARNTKQSSLQRSVRLRYQRTYQLAKSRGKTNFTFLNIARSMQVTETSDDIIDEYSVGRMEYHCSHCSAKFWENEKLSTSTKDDFKFSLCCGQGKVVIPALPSPPELLMLMHLLTATDSRGRAFREHIRAYNSALAFASLGVNLDKELASARRGVYTFRIHGVVHHYIGQLTPRVGETPSFAQIYIHDGTPEGELENRQRHLGDASLPELRLLQNLLHEVNPYVSHFRQGVAMM